MVIYCWPDGSWIYSWETHSFTMEHSATLEGGRWIDLDKDMSQHFTKEEQQAILEALGE